MKNLVSILLFACAIFLVDGCCTKMDCDTISYPNIILYFPEASSPLHTLSYISLDRTTHKMVDSFTTTCGGKSCPFNPWFLYPRNDWHTRNDWKNFDYALSIDEYTGFKDTVSNISFDEVVDLIPCNDCFPSSSNGNAKAISYTNLVFYHKGVALHDGDTVVMRK